MSVYVFTGPTISASEAAKELEAVYLPPAAEGDVYRATLIRRPRVIGIIDGYFQSVPAVRHKEILWAMSQGVHVFGSASMGALRAAELAPFGMEGIGKIFESYRGGVLEDDDEVAVIHGPPDLGYPVGSEAMVNIRQTLAKAEREGVISGKARIEAIAKNLFYSDRNYRLILRLGVEAGIPETALKRLETWLPENRVDQKKQDAIAMLRAIRQRLKSGIKPKQIPYHFEHTVTWETAMHHSGKMEIAPNGQSTLVDLEAILDELRLTDGDYHRYCQLARERFLAVRETSRLGVNVGPLRKKKTEEEFRREQKLVRAADLARWMKDNDVTGFEFEGLITEEARIRWLKDRIRVASIRYILQQLRLSGRYRSVKTRAIAKRRLFESKGLSLWSLTDANLTETKLLHWYFENVRKTSVPKNIEVYARDLGYATGDAFRRALFKEYLFRAFKGEQSRVGR